MGIRHATYEPPFPYFGGKSAVADVVWQALGNPVNFIEPFFGSGAVLFLRDEPGHIETVNDADGLVANFWRSLQHDAASVAEHADNPVNEADLHARHIWLIGQRERITERLCGDPDWFDAKAAGWWAWGLCCWIGSGWCSGKGPWTSEAGEMVLRDPGKGVNRKLPHLGDPGKGVNRKLPHLGDPGKGVNRKLPHLGDPGKGDEPETAGERAKRLEWLTGYLQWFGDRLRNVRVCCGDWSRVCGPSVTFRHGTTGIFLDPPYADTAKRTAGLYAVDCEQVAHAAREWAISQGDNPDMRIVVAGYDGEHQFPSSWKVHEWEAAGGYGLEGGEDSKGRKNRKREQLWLSPACQQTTERNLFDGAA
jgi:hypothetical protein